MIFLFFGKSEYYGDDLIDFYLLKIYFACITRQRKCRIRKLNETFFFFFWSSWMVWNCQMNF